MSEPVDIREQLDGLCAALGIERTDASVITIKPSSVVAVVYKRNADGKFYVEMGEAVAETLRFAVTT